MPDNAGGDPLLLIDRVPDNNLKKVDSELKSLWLRQ
jgi:hypothetical protein